MTANNEMVDGVFGAGAAPKDVRKPVTSDELQTVIDKQRDSQ